MFEYFHEFITARWLFHGEFLPGGRKGGGFLFGEVFASLEAAEACLWQEEIFQK